MGSGVRVLLVLFALFLGALSQNDTFSPTVMPTPSTTYDLCTCDTYVAGNYTKTDLSGRVSEDDVCSSCYNDQCTCAKSALCGAIQDLVEGLGTAIIVVIVVASICGFCCICGLAYCVCAGGAVCCLAAKGQTSA